ncbi:MAG: hypothetical protein FWC79_06040 [Oscillospiraceae bacterium]|nr:hypothetical protein [Oscillospiraceae bacterium]
MNYRNYGDYMGDMVHHHMPHDMCPGCGGAQEMHHTYEGEHEMPSYAPEMDELNDMYPEVYRIMYPMVRRTCNQYRHRRITREVLDDMVTEVYSNMEPEEVMNVKDNLMRNGDVKNPNVKEGEASTETRNRNFLLQDFIKVLLVRDLLRPGGFPPHYRPCHCRPGRPCHCRPGRPRRPHYRMSELGFGEFY